MNKVKNFKGNVSKEGALLITEIDIIPLAVGNRIMNMAKEKNLLPSVLLNPANIVLDTHPDNWNTFDISSSHFLDLKLLTIYSDTKALELSLDIITHYFDDVYEILPMMKCNQPSDWPYLFLAQLQMLSELKGTNPSEALYIFGIIYMGDQEDCWTNFDWMSFIHPMHVTISLACHRNKTN